MVKKKATKKEIELVLSNLLRQVEFLNGKLYELNTSFGLYLDWKKDKDKFIKFMEDEFSKAQERFKDTEKEPGETK